MSYSVSIIITAWKEEKSIPKAINSLLSPENQLPEDFEVIIASPDKSTLSAAEDALKQLNITNYKLIQDPGKKAGKGKPTGLNMAFKAAKGDIFVLTDGDVYLSPNAIKHLLEPFKDKKIGGVTGRPVSADSTDNMMGYFGNLLADAAHHKRMIDLTEHPEGFSTKLVKKRDFFPMSGYVMAMRNLGFKLPEDVLSDDAHTSYEIFNKGYKIAYRPEAKAYVKYATNLSDYFTQKKRSLGGFIQLWKYGVVKEETKSRSFWHELEYFWFPIKYARSLRQYFWSLLLYPIRFYLWLQIWYERKFTKKKFDETWVRIESTK